MPTGSKSLATYCLRPFEAGAVSPDAQFTPLLMKDDATEAQNGEPHLPGHPDLTRGSSPTFPDHCYVHQMQPFFFTLGLTYSSWICKQSLLEKWYKVWEGRNIKTISSLSPSGSLLSVTSRLQGSILDSNSFPIDGLTLGNSIHL